MENRNGFFPPPKKQPANIRILPFDGIKIILSFAEKRNTMDYGRKTSRTNQVHESD